MLRQFQRRVSPWFQFAPNQHHLKGTDAPPTSPERIHCRADSAASLAVRMHCASPASLRIHCFPGSSPIPIGMHCHICSSFTLAALGGGVHIPPPLPYFPDSSKRYPISTNFQCLIRHRFDVSGKKLRKIRQEIFEKIVF